MAIRYLRATEINGGGASSDANDGLDPFGHGLTTATWTASSNTLTQTGAFTNYTHSANDFIEITGGTGATTGTYVVSSKTDNDSIVLATQIAVGDLATGDITSSNGPKLTPQGLVDSCTAAGDEGRLCSATYTLSASVDLDTAGGANAMSVAAPLVLTGCSDRGAVDGSIATIDGNNAATHCFSSDASAITAMRIRNLRLTNGATSCFYANNSALVAVTFDNVRFDNANGSTAGTHGCYIHTASARPAPSFYRCRFDNGAAHGFCCDSATRGGASFYGCSFHDNTQSGARLSNYEFNLFFKCAIYRNATDGIDYPAAFDTTNDRQKQVFIDSVIFNNTAAGIDVNQTNVDRAHIVLINTIVRSHNGAGDLGIDNTGATAGGFSVDYIDFSTFSDNTSDLAVGSAFPAESMQNTDPSFDSETNSTEDFNIGAAALIEGGFPGTFVNNDNGDPLATDGHSIGLAQPVDAAGGGGETFTGPKFNREFN